MSNIQIVTRGSPPPPPSPWGDDIPYYWEGEEFVETTGGWVEGETVQTGTQSKQADHLYLETTRSGATAARVYTTDLVVDLTNITTLHVDWECTQAPSSDVNGASLFQVATSANKNTSSFTATKTINGTFARKIDFIDVSGMTGTYHVRVRIFIGVSASAGEKQILKTYRVWGEAQ